MTNQTYPISFRTDRIHQLYEKRIAAMQRNGGYILEAQSIPQLREQSANSLSRLKTLFEKQKAAVIRNRDYHLEQVTRHGLEMKQSPVAECVATGVNNPLVKDYLDLLILADEAFYVLFVLFSSGKMTRDDFRKNTYELRRMTERMTGRVRNDGEQLYGLMQKTQSAPSQSKPQLAQEANTS